MSDLRAAFLIETREIVNSKFFFNKCLLPVHHQPTCGYFSPLFEIARVLVPFDHLARLVVNANHSIMRTAEKLGLADCFAHSIRFAIRAEAHRCGVKVWPIERARNLGVTSANGFRNAGRKSTRNTCPGKVIPL